MLSTDQVDLITEALIMTMTPPNKLESFDETGILQTPNNNFWKAANYLFGAIWQQTQEPNPTSQLSKRRNLQSTPKKTKNLGFRTRIQDNFITREVRDEPNISKTKNKETYIPSESTFLKLEIPFHIESNVSYNDDMNRMIDHIATIWSTLLKTDVQHNRILPFQDIGLVQPETEKPLTAHDTSSGTIKSRKSILPYIHEFNPIWSTDWKGRTHSTFEFCLGHDRPFEEIFNAKSVQSSFESFLKFNGQPTYLEISRLQTGKRVNVGNLLGPVMSETSLRSLESSIKSKLLGKVKELALTVQLHKTSNLRLQKGDPRVNDIHVWTDELEEAKLYKELRKIYPSTPLPRTSYPEGIQYRFVPNILNSNRVIAPKVRVTINNLILKQHAFNKQIQQLSYPHIQNIHKEGKFFVTPTLYKLLMCIKSTRFPDRYLFVAVEQDFKYGPTIFYYLPEMYDELQSTIPALPLIIQGNFGKTQADEWFSHSSWHATADWEYQYVDPSNKALGAMLVPSQAEDFVNMDTEWELDTEDAALQDVTDIEDAIFISNIELADMNSTDYILDDDNASCATGGKSYFGKYSGTNTTAASASPLSSMTESTSVNDRFQNLHSALRASGYTEEQIKELETGTHPRQEEPPIGPSEDDMDDDL